MSLSAVEVGGTAKDLRYSPFLLESSQDSMIGNLHDHDVSDFGKQNFFGEEESHDFWMQGSNINDGFGTTTEPADEHVAHVDTGGAGKTTKRIRQAKVSRTTFKQTKTALVQEGHEEEQEEEEEEEENEEEEEPDGSGDEQESEDEEEESDEEEEDDEDYVERSGNNQSSSTSRFVKAKRLQPKQSVKTSKRTIRTSLSLKAKVRKPIPVDMLDKNKRYCKYQPYGCIHRGYVKAEGKCIERHEENCEKRFAASGRKTRSSDLHVDVDMENGAGASSLLPSPTEGVNLDGLSLQARSPRTKSFSHGHSSAPVSTDNASGGAMEDLGSNDASTEAGMNRNRTRKLDAINAELDEQEKMRLKGTRTMQSGGAVHDHGMLSNPSSDGTLRSVVTATGRHPDNRITEESHQQTVSSPHMNNMSSSVDGILHEIDASQRNLDLSRQESKRKKAAFTNASNEYLRVLRVNPDALASQRRDIYTRINRDVQATFEQSKRVTEEFLNNHQRNHSTPQPSPAKALSHSCFTPAGTRSATTFQYPALIRSVSSA